MTSFVFRHLVRCA